MTFNILLKNLSFILILFFLGKTSFAQIQTSGVETIVNTTIVNSQIEPAVSMDTAGNFVVVWSSFEQDGDDYGVYFQRYSNGGSTVGSETLINSTTTYGQRAADVSSWANGSFVVVWESDQQDGDGYGTWYAVYNNSGVLIASNRVNSSGADESMLPKVATSYSGDFVIVFSDDAADGNEQGVVVRSYNNSGTALAAETIVNTTTAGCQGIPDVAMDSAGNYIVVWQGVDADGLGVYGQMYDNSHAAIGSEFLINSITSGNQQEPSVSMDNDGNFFVAWSSYAQDGDQMGVYGMLFDNTGTALTGEIGLNSTTSDYQDNVDVDASKDGKYFVSWTSFGQDGDKAGIYVQGINSDGTLYGSETQVNTRTTDFQQLPAVACYDEADEMVIAWQDGLRNSSATHDGDDYGVYIQRFKITDNIPPTAVCQNITAYLDGSGSVTLTPSDVDGGSTDNVAVTSSSLDISSFSCADIGVNNVVLTVFDAAGNSDNCSSQVTIVDTVSPSVVCQNITVYLDGAGNATITAADVDGGSTDNCSSVTLSASQTSFTCADAGASTVTLSATDASGNSSLCSSTVTVVDSISPTAVCQNVTVYLDGSGNATITASDIDGGSSDNCGSPTLSASQTSFTCADAGVNTVTLTATDAFGNSSSCTSTVTVVDSISPTAVCQNITVYLDGAGNAIITASDVDGGSNDNCSVAAMSVSPAIFTCSNLGSNNVTLTVTDASGNVSTCVSNVTILDSIVPVPDVASLSAVTDECSATLTAPTATDNCAGVIIGTTIDPISYTTEGTYSVTWTYDDGNGNTSTQTQTVIIDDVTAPVADVATLSDVTAECSATLIAPTATDNCSRSITGTTIDPTSYTTEGTYTVTWTYDDGNGNTSTQTQTVIIDDVTAPVADVATLSDVTAECSATLTAPTATDNCLGSITGTTTDPTSYTTEGTYTVTWTYDDGNGNTSTQSQTVIVDDITAPIVNCPSNQTETPGANCEFTIPDYTSLVTVSDNCSSSPSLTQNPVAGTIITGTTTIWMISDDGNGNSDSCSFDVILSDAIAPSALCQDLNVYLDLLGGYTLNAADLDGGSTDNCSGLIFSVSQSVFTCSDLGNNTITLTVTDGNSNSATCSSTVTVIDTIAPIADLLPIPDATGECSVTLAAPTATDNCSGSITGTTTDPTTYSTEGTYTVNWTYDDGNGNTSSQIQTIIVDDITAPSLACPGDQSETPDANCEFTLLDYTSLVTSSDNCSSTISISQSPAAGTLINGNTTIWMYGDDGNGNVDSCSFDVLLIDVTPPTAVCQNITVYLDSTGNYSLSGSELDGGSTDNCSGLIFTASQTLFNCTDIGSITVDLTVTDGAGNSDICSSTVTIVDTIGPLPDTLSLTALNGECIVTALAPTATDNCSGSITATTTDPVTYSNQGIYTVNWEYVDANGNTTLQTQTIVVNDTTLPTVVCPGDTTLNVLSGTCSAIVNGISATASDNCFSNPVITYSLSGATISSGNDDVSGVEFNAGITSVTYYATDDNGNVDSCSFNVTVIDNEAPQITCLGDTVVPFDSTCSYTMTDLSLHASVIDNCNVTLSQSPSVGATITDTTLVTIYATDPSGNIDSCSFYVIPTDQTAPVIDCVDSDVLVLDGDCEATLPDYTQLISVTDACDATPVFNQYPTAGEIYTGVGSMEVLLTAQDASGNIDSCSVIVTIETDANSGCEQALIIADLLTPNGDGQNDTWKIKELSYIDGCTVMIFNRWGQKLYETTSYQNEWDGTYNGKQLPDGAYFYVIECDGEVKYKGPVTLMRLSK